MSEPTKNRLLMSQVAYFLNYRGRYTWATTWAAAEEGSPWLSVFCPKHQQGGIWQASFQKTHREVNIPEGIEKPCSLQEDDKPNVGVSKNRCLMSQMDYSLNCQLNTYKDRKDDEEDQKHRDSENKLLTSEAAYDRGCRLETEVPGFLCSAPKRQQGGIWQASFQKEHREGTEESCSQQEEDTPNVGADKNRLLMSQVAYFLNYQEDIRVSKVASGRPPSRKNTEVNVPEGTEESCSQQEEDTPNVGADKNRLLMSQVAYFLNYRRKIYEDRKDHGEEQKYRDSKNKLLMSKVGYYLGCRLKREVPGFLCSAPNISKASFRKHTEEVNIPEGIEKPCSLQEDDKPNVGVSKNRCLMSQMDYSLNCQLNTYKDRKDDEEDQKHRDSENKLLTSEAAYDRGCRLETEVPGFLCSAPSVSKVASGRPPSRKNTEVNVPEGTEESCSQQEEDTPNVGADKK
ncbi:hypothetical protein AAY473_038145 [Plecturocebus cupreus]